MAVPVDALGVTTDPIIRELWMARLQQGISQKRLALMIGSHASIISTAERGLHLPRLDILYRWAEALGLDVVLVDRVVVTPTLDGAE